MTRSGATVVYASAAGAHLDSDVLAGGGIDDTDALQSVLDRAPEIGSLHLVIDGAALVRGLDIHSNTTIECPNPACGFFLADGADRAILRNANPCRDKILDRNISILGGTYNNNRRNQVHHTAENLWVTAMDFFGIEQLTLRDVVIRDQRTFAVFVSNFRRVLMEHVDILLTDRTEGNTDGLHFCGPGQFLTLRDIQGCAWDDFIALNADDGHTSYDEHGELHNNGELGEYASFGPITDVLIDGVILDEAAQGIRFLSRTSRIDRVIVRNVFGTYRSFGFFMDPFWAPGGNYGSIVFDTLDLRPLKPNFDYLPPFLFAIGGRHESLTIRNLHHHYPEDNRRLIWIQKDGEVESLTVDGLAVTTAPETDAPNCIVVEGDIRRLRVHNAQITNAGDAPTGSLITVCPDRRGHGIGHLQLDGVTAHNLGALVRRVSGRVDRIDSTGVTLLDAACQPVDAEAAPAENGDGPLPMD